MHIAFAFIATLVLIALGVWQMRPTKDSRGRDFAIIAIIALMMTLYYNLFDADSYRLIEVGSKPAVPNLLILVGSSLIIGHAVADDGQPLQANIRQFATHDAGRLFLWMAPRNVCGAWNEEESMGIMTTWPCRTPRSAMTWSANALASACTARARPRALDSRFPPHSV